MSETFGTGAIQRTSSKFRSANVFGPSIADKSDKGDLKQVFLGKKKRESDFVKKEFSKHTRTSHTHYTGGVEKFIFPTKKRLITSAYGWRSGSRFHDGIDIGGKSGDEIYAVASGIVIYSDNRISGYGNMIVIKHPSGYSTVYAHNKVNKVKKNDRVRQGQVIALMGSTGRATGVHLHFEVRDREGYSKNPMNFLK